MNKNRLFKRALICIISLSAGLSTYVLFNHQKETIHEEDGHYESDVIKSEIINISVRWYKDFRIREPRFISATSKTLFQMNRDNMKYIGGRNELELRGMICVIRNGTYAPPHDCGYKGNVADLLIPRTVQPENWFHKAAPLLIPEGKTFQHFLDGVLPKLVRMVYRMGRSLFFCLSTILFLLEHELSCSSTKCCARAQALCCSTISFVL